MEREPFDIAAEPRDAREAVAHLEERIEQLAARLESCRKFILAGRVVIALGAALLAMSLFGLIRLDGLGIASAITAILGGIVVLGSNGSTAKEASAQLAAAETERAALIGTMELRTVAERPVLH